MFCFDTETTGLEIGSDEIIQLTLIDSDNWETYNNFFSPQYKTNFPEASNVTGLYYDQPVPMYPDGPLLCEYPPISDPDVFDKIQKMLDSSYELMGYHVAYDVKMMEAAGFDMSNHVYYDPMYAFAIFYWSTHPDEKHTTKSGKVMESWMPWKNQYISKNLTFAANCFGISFGAHDSSEDVRATIELYHALRDVEYSYFVPGNYAYDESGEIIYDVDCYECYADETGLALIYPTGHRIESFFPDGGFDLSTLMAMDE